MAINNGTVKAYPILKATGPGRLYKLHNLTTGHKIDFDILIQTGETVILDLRPGKKTFISSFRGNVISSVLQGSDTNEFHLIPGQNNISIFIDDATATATATLTWPERHASYSSVSLVQEATTIPTPPFSPAAVSGLQLWLDANDPATIFQDSAFTIPATLDGHPVGGWLDKSSSSRSALQGTAFNKPYLSVSTFPINGQPIIRFSGATDFLSFADMPSLPGTIFVVMLDVTPDGLLPIPLLGNSATATGFYTAQDQFFSSELHLIGNGLVFATSFPLGAFQSVPNISSFDISGSNVNFWVNGVNQGLLSHTETALLLNTIGNLAGGDFFEGSVAEVVAYNLVLSPVDRQLVEQYLTAKWAI